MNTPASRVRLPLNAIDDRTWPAVAETVLDALAARGLPVRDAFVLVPSLPLVALARRAFAAHGGWQPRVETHQSLAASLGPPSAAEPGDLTFDAVVDRLAAAALLRQRAGGAAWSTRDPRGFDQAAAALADTAKSFARAAFARRPEQRDAFWQQARERLSPVSGPGATERLLARIALEWAAAAPPPASDALYGLQPSAWVIVDVVPALAAEGGFDPPPDRPVLHLELDAAAGALPPPPARWVSEDFEAEAQACATGLLQGLNARAAGAPPALLVAEDRLLVRRVRALLERAGVGLRDETGWKLSTTRAAAQVMACLRACDLRAGPRARRDALLDWLKASCPGPELRSLEASWRRSQPAQGAAAELEARALERLQPLAEAPRQALSAWLEQLRRALADDLAALEADDAGRQVLAAMRLGGADGEAWRSVAADSRFDLAGFTAWVDTTLEATRYRPPADAAPEVVVTPLAQAFLRPFCAAVFPGTDERHFGAGASPHPLLPQVLLEALGLPSANERRKHDALGLALLLRGPSVTLLRRSSDEGQPLAVSPLVEQAGLAARRQGRAWPAEVPSPLARALVTRRPTGRPAPAAAGALPQRLSASAVEALRECPYRFFSRAVLRLREPEELDAELHKRDFGNWVHAVLLRFHAERAERAGPLPPAEEAARLLATADAVQDEQGLDAAQWLPLRAGFASFAPHYAAWLHGRDLAGWAFEDGEVPRRAAPPALAGTELDGRIDRIDEGPAGVQLIDYKTGNADELRRRVREPLEDTQLPFYAALLGPAPQPLQALYLALDERDLPREIAHPGVAETAVHLIDGLGHDLHRLRGGAGLPALGEGRVCETCEARGLCRRDHWAAPV